MKKWLIQLLIALAIIVQFASITMPMDLEIFQAQLGMPGTRHDFRLGQRIINVTCLVSPKWSDRCIANHPDKQQILNTWNHLAFLPFTFEQKAKHHPAALKYLGFVGMFWLVCLILAMGYTISFVGRT